MYYVESTRRGEPATHVEDAEGAFGVAGISAMRHARLSYEVLVYLSSPPRPMFCGGGTGRHGDDFEAHVQ